MNARGVTAQHIRMKSIALLINSFEGAINGERKKTTIKWWHFRGKAYAGVVAVGCTDER